MTEAHDPTRSGAPVPAHAAHFSRSEIEAVCLKAARGAGFPWGLAEEAGHAARQLAEAGLPGPEWLLACLEGPRGGAPDVDGAVWQAAEQAAGPLCPIATGAALADRAGRLPSVLSLRDVLVPGLLLAFLAQAAAPGKGFRMEWDGGAASAGPDRIALAGQPPARADIRITPAEAAGGPPPQPGRVVALDLWQRLNALALATTVPASDASRAGAGAGTVDND